MTFTAFAYLHDTVRVNTKTVFQKAKKRLSAWDFGIQFAQQRVLSHEWERKLNFPMLNKIRLFAADRTKNYESTQVDSKQRQRYRYYLDESHDKGGKKKKDSFGWTINKCRKCNEAICYKKICYNK